MLVTDWMQKAEFQIETLRKAAEIELQAIRHDFPSWQKEDVRQCAIMRLGTILFVPVVSLYTMRVHMCDPAWWEQHATGAGSGLAAPGRTAFDRGIKGKLILDLVRNLEHSFRLILGQLDPHNGASKFWSICQSLFRSEKPYLSSIPTDWEPTMKLLRLIRNTVHNAWAHFPENGKDETVVFRDITFQFVVGQPLTFISWDLLGNISESVIKIVTAVVRDANVTCLPPIKDFGVEQALPAEHKGATQPTVS